MFIQKSGKAVKKFNAIMGERDDLHVSKNENSFDIKVGAGKSKLKIIKTYKDGSKEVSTHDVVGTTITKGVEGVDKIETTNTFSDEYSECYSGYEKYDYEDLKNGESIELHFDTIKEAKEKYLMPYFSNYNCVGIFVGDKKYFEKCGDNIFIHKEEELIVGYTPREQFGIDLGYRVKSKFPSVHKVFRLQHEKHQSDELDNIAIVQDSVNNINPNYWGTPNIGISLKRELKHVEFIKDITGTAPRLRYYHSTYQNTWSMYLEDCFFLPDYNHKPTLDFLKKMGYEYNKKLISTDFMQYGSMSYADGREHTVSVYDSALKYNFKKVLPKQSIWGKIKIVEQVNPKTTSLFKLHETAKGWEFYGGYLEKNQVEDIFNTMNIKLYDLCVPSVHHGHYKNGSLKLEYSFSMDDVSWFEKWGILPIKEIKTPRAELIKNKSVILHELVLHGGRGDTRNVSCFMDTLKFKEWVGVGSTLAFSTWQGEVINNNIVMRTPQAITTHVINEFGVTLSVPNDTITFTPYAEAFNNQVRDTFALIDSKDFILKDFIMGGEYWWRNGKMETRSSSYFSDFHFSSFFEWKNNKIKVKDFFHGYKTPDKLKAVITNKYIANVEPFISELRKKFYFSYLDKGEHEHKISTTLTIGQVKKVVERILMYNFFHLKEGFFKIPFSSSHLVTISCTKVSNIAVVREAKKYCTSPTVKCTIEADTTPKPSDKLVTLEYTDKDRVRSITYSSPIEIKSIGVNGLKILKQNRYDEFLKKPIKFQSGGMSIMWNEDNSITIVNPAYVFDLQIGNANFVLKGN